jgi:MFS transporter, DHA1 family, tetracycline resistance protein
VVSTEKQPQLFPILLVNFIGTLGFSIVLPFLVFLVRDFGGNAIAYGILGAIYSAFQLIGAPFWENGLICMAEKNSSIK